MTGSIEAFGNIQSLLNYSNIAPSACYYGMFSECTSLKKAPQLPATRLKYYCYNYMFSNCSNLSSAPQLPATTLEDDCYRGMFFNCSNLSSAPSILPATTLKNYCYAYMFNGCTALTDAPYLPATTIIFRSYYYMFSGCSNLSNINVAFTAWSQASYQATYSWVSGVAASGTFTCPTALGTNSTIIRGTSYCPTNWTVVNK